MDLVVILFPLFALWTGNVELWLCGIYMYLVVSNMGKTKTSLLSDLASLTVITGASVKHRYAFILLFKLKLELTQSFSFSVDLTILSWALYGSCAGLYVIQTLVSWEYQNSLSKATAAEKRLPVRTSGLRL